ncbi:MAG: hypothetical protein ACRYGK_13180 [Janthinobacterium lividum]
MLSLETLTLHHYYIDESSTFYSSTCFGKSGRIFFQLLYGRQKVEKKKRFVRSPAIGRKHPGNNPQQLTAAWWRMYKEAALTAKFVNN